MSAPLSSTALRRIISTSRQRMREPLLRQLRSLVKAYATSSGPELLVFGDSAMVFTTHLDDDHRNLADMIQAAVGGGLRVHTVAGPGFNARLVAAFLDAIELARSRPRAVIAPTSVLMATTLWAEHPVFGYYVESKALRELIASGEFKRRRLPHADEERFENYDRRPAPSLIGSRRTAGELRLFVNANPTTRWQTAVRMRALMDYYNAEVLNRDSPGVALVNSLGQRFAELRLPGIGYVAPVNHEIVATTLGAGSVEHLARNAAVVTEAFLAGAGEYGAMVNAVLDSPSAEFIDPVHLTATGRNRLATKIAATVSDRLVMQKPPTASE